MKSQDFVQRVSDLGACAVREPQETRNESDDDQGPRVFDFMFAGQPRRHLDWQGLAEPHVAIYRRNGIFPTKDKLAEVSLVTVGAWYAKPVPDPVGWLADLTGEEYAVITGEWRLPAELAELVDEFAQTPLDQRGE